MRTKREEEPASDAPAEDVVLLTEIRDLLRDRAGLRRAGGHTRRVPEPTATLTELLRPLKEDPKRSAVLLDVDGVLAPIVQNADDAHMPETTRRPLIEVARRYGVVACVSGRRASDARRIVSLGSISYLGSHGSEVLRAGSIQPEMDRELQAWTKRVQDFAHEAFGEKLRRLRVRLEDKEAIAGAALARRARRGGGRGGDPRGRRRGRDGRLHLPLGAQGAGDPAARADRQGRGHRQPAARHGPRRGRLRRRRRDRPGRVPRHHRAGGDGPPGHRREGRRALGRRARRRSRRRPTRWSRAPTASASC